jgi:hypothetical protein
VWPKFAEHELAEPDRRRAERLLGEAKLLPGKTLASFGFEAVPMIGLAASQALSKLLAHGTHEAFALCGIIESLFGHDLVK